MLQHSGNTDRFAMGIQDCFARWRAIFGLDSPLLSHVKRHGIRPPNGLGVEVHIVSDQKIANTDHCCAGFLVENCWPEIWFPLRLFYLFEKSFVFASSNHSKIS